MEQAWECWVEHQIVDSSKFVYLIYFDLSQTKDLPWYSQNWRSVCVIWNIQTSEKNETRWISNKKIVISARDHPCHQESKKYHSQEVRTEFTNCGIYVWKFLRTISLEKRLTTMCQQNFNRGIRLYDSVENSIFDALHAITNFKLQRMPWRHTSIRIGWFLSISGLWIQR